MPWQTLFTSKFGCRLPIMAPPMIGVSGARLVAAAQSAGALGFLPAGHLENVGDLQKEIALYRSLTNNQETLSLGFIGHSATSSSSLEQWQRYEKILEEEKPAFVQFFAPAVSYHPTTGQSNIELAQKYDALVMAQVGNVESAVQAWEAGADALIVQGAEAGGHGLRPPLGRSLLPLLADVKALVRNSLPVLAAGGIVTGQTAAAVLCAGADGVVIGTRLWASQQALGHETYKQAMVEAPSCDAVVRTTVVDQIQNHYTPYPWPQPFDSLGMLRNEVTEKWQDKSKELGQALGSDTCPSLDYRTANQEGNAQRGAVLSGQGVGQIQSIESVEDIIAKIDQEMKQTIENIANQLLE